MVTIKRKVTLKTKTSQEEMPERVDVKKVTLKKKQAEPSVVTEQKPQIKHEDGVRTSPQDHEKTSNTGKIIGGLIIVAAIIIGVYFFGMKDSDKPTEDNIVASTELLARNDENTTEDAAAGSIPTGDNTSNGEENSTDEVSDSLPKDAVNVPSANDGSSSLAQDESNKAEEKSSVTSSGVSSAASSIPLSGEVEENARRVIRGDYGNGQVRKDKLGAAYAEIQSMVNEMYRQGLEK